MAQKKNSKSHKREPERAEFGRGQEIYLVTSNGLLHVRVAVRVQVVGPHEDAALGGAHRKGADAGHDVAHGLARSKELDQAVVLLAQFAVPVDLGVVEVEDQLPDPGLHLHPGLAGQELEREGAVFGPGADVAGLVDDRLQRRVLVEQHRRDQRLVRQKMGAKVEMRWW